MQKPSHFVVGFVEGMTVSHLVRSEDAGDAFGSFMEQHPEAVRVMVYRNEKEFEDGKTPRLSIREPQKCAGGGA